RDVVARAEDGAGLRHPALDVERARDPEVGHLRLALSVQEDVLRLHVAVDEPVLVRERESAGDLDRQLERAAYGERPASIEELLQVLAVDVLEDDELAPLVLAAVDHRDDVRVREPGDGARLVAEARDVLLVVCVLRVEDLQGYVALEQRVARPVDGGHAAAADDLLEVISVRNLLLAHAGP